MVVDHGVVQVYGGGEGVAGELDGFLMPVQGFAAVHGVAGFGMHQRGQLQFGQSLFFGIEPLPFHGLVSCPERTVLGIDVVQPAAVCIGVLLGQFDVEQGLAGGGEDDLGIVFGVAGHIDAAQLGEDVRHFHIIAQQIQCLVHGVRAGVHDFAAVEAQGSLPVPSAGEAVELNGNLHDFPQLPGGQQFLDLDVVRCVPGLLECGDHNAVLLGGGDHFVHVRRPACKGLFADYVEAVVGQINGDGGMHIAEGGVDNQINLILHAEQLGIVRKHRASEILCRSVSAVFDGIHNSHNFKIGIGGRQKICAMDIPAASALTDNGYSQFFHGILSPYLDL